MGENANTGAVRRCAVPAVVLAAVTALPAVAVAAPEPPDVQAAQQSVQQAAGQAAPLPCSQGRGDEAALVRAFRAGGMIMLEPGCTYPVTKRYGENSALPEVMRDTTIEGQNSTIAWRGSERVRSLIEIAGRRVRFVLRGVSLKPGPGVAPIRTRAGTSASISHIGANHSFGDWRNDPEAAMLASWLMPTFLR